MNANEAGPPEAIKAQAERILPGPLTDEEIASLAAVAPAFYALVKGRAEGVLPSGRRATDEALRGANKPLLDYLVFEALNLFRRSAQGSQPLDAAPDLCAVAAFLRFAESDDEDFDLRLWDERMYETAHRFAHLILIEATRRTVGGWDDVNEKRELL